MLTLPPTPRAVSTSGNATAVAVAIAFVSLAVGAVFYVFARPHGSTLVRLPDAGALHWAVADTVPILGALPSLLHVFTFGLLTAAVIGLNKRAALAGPAVWLVIDAAFEWLQIPAVRSRARALLDAAAGSRPADWLLPGAGTFDPMDLAALGLGAALAALIVALIRISSCRESHHAGS